MDERLATVLLIVGITVSLVMLSFLVDIEYGGVHCVVCEWNWVYIELSDYNDPGYGHVGALDDIWNEANYGKEYDLEWYENYRLKYNLTKVRSFTLINYSNPRPRSPKIKFMDEGNITEIRTNRDVGYPELVYINPIINGTKYSWKIVKIPVGIDETLKVYDLFNVSHHYFVYKQKGHAWHRTLKNAIIVDASENPNHKNNTLQLWSDYQEKYNQYLLNGGVNLGDDYWM